jgi:hypothetical protein
MSEVFVNVNGDLFSPELSKPVKRDRREQPDSFHRGYQVLGIPPGALEEARRKHLEAQVAAKNPKEWNEQHWLMNARKKPVHKPYELRAAAEQCREMAEKAGWLLVEVVELKKDARAHRGEPAYALASLIGKE